MQKAGQICVDEMRKQKGGNEKGGRKKRERAREGDGEGDLGRLAWRCANAYVIVAYLETTNRPK